MASAVIYTNKLELYKELEAHQEGEFFAVADTKIKNHLPPWVQFSPGVFWLSAPEEQKNLETFTDAVTFFLNGGISRSSTIYAFGGGATTDLAGFIAATILRGVSWKAVPTTLLAMIDGSLGGKVAVNTSSGKNLVGNFYEPQKIFICHDFLNSLNEENWHSGKGEVLKYGFLSKEICELIRKKSSIDKIIKACADFKMEIVKRDLHERGERIQLNLGHTLGHAFETTLKISHGRAVAMGLRYIFEVMGESSSLALWKELVAALDLPQEKLTLGAYSGFDKKMFFDQLQHDKKRTRESVRIVLAPEPGRFTTQEIPFSELKTRINAHVDFAD